MGGGGSNILHAYWQFLVVFSLQFPQLKGLMNSKILDHNS